MTTTALVTNNQHITIKNLDGADRSGVVITAGKESAFGQFITLRLDTPYTSEYALNESKTVSLRIVRQGDAFAQLTFGKFSK